MKYGSSIQVGDNHNYNKVTFAGTEKSFSTGEQREKARTDQEWYAAALKREAASSSSSVTNGASTECHFGFGQKLVLLRHWFVQPFDEEEKGRERATLPRLSHIAAAAAPAPASAHVQTQQQAEGFFVAAQNDCTAVQLGTAVPTAADCQK
jgi:hypothetical protein